MEEMPILERFTKTHQNQAIKVILLSLDGLENVSRYRSFLVKHPLELETYLLHAPNFNQWIERIDSNYWGTMPATLIFNNRNKRRHFINRKIKVDELEEVILQWSS
jgi:hypothetical protein